MPAKTSRAIFSTRSAHILLIGLSALSFRQSREKQVEGIPSLLRPGPSKKETLTVTTPNRRLSTWVKSSRVSRVASFPQGAMYGEGLEGYNSGGDNAPLHAEN